MGRLSPVRRACRPRQRELSPQATEGENLQSVCSEARHECGVGAVPRLRARRTASTFHRRKVDRKAAGGPLYQRRNAPRNPPFADSEDGFCCIPSPRPSRGLAPLCKGSWQGRQALTEGLWVAYRSGLTVTGCFLLHLAYNPSGSHPFATSPYTGEARVVGESSLRTTLQGGKGR